MTFRYWPTEIPRTPLRDGTTVHRPLLPVRVTHAAGTPAYLWALADTGADHTLFPASIAETIGLSLSSDDATTVVGFGGTELQVTPAHVDLSLSDDTRQLVWTARVGFVTFDSPDHELAVLGHGGFFEFFAATFDGRARELSLIPTADFPGTL